MDVIFSSATVLADAIRRRKVGAVEVLEAHLAQIRRHNPRLNAIVTLDEEGALARAREADAAIARGETLGPLHGLPMTLKDGLETAGMRTTAGSPLLASHVPTEDSGVVARLKRAGANIIGKTNVPELLADYQCDNPVFGRTGNPWSLGRTSGGSSGGAAAAIAAGLVPLELGSDLGGSIRYPAHFCGVYGLKPTEHRVSLAGHIPELPTLPRNLRILAAIGPLARSIEDLALAFGVIAGADGRDTDVPPLPVRQLPQPPLSALRIAWAPTFPGVPVDREIAAAVEGLAAELARRGARVEERLPALDFPAQRELFSKLVETVVRAFKPGATVPFAGFADYLAALDRRDGFIRAWERFFDNWDVLLCPPAMRTAIEHCPTGAELRVNGAPAGYWQMLGHACPFNLTGHPVVSLPLGFDREGLPIGAQLVGRRWQDESLLANASAVAAATDGFRRPPGFDPPPAPPEA